MTVRTFLTSVGKAGGTVRGIWQQMRDDPLGFVADTLLRILAFFFIPIPGAGEFLVMVRPIILALVVSVVIVVLVTGMMMLKIFLIPTAISHGIYTQLTTYLSWGIDDIGDFLFGDGISNVIEELQGYREEGYYDMHVPRFNPFGGIGYAWTTITATFMDPDYLFFEGIHLGIDLVPNSAYQLQNEAYALTSQPIVFATHNGSCLHYIDSYGALVVEITNSPGSVKTVYMHFDQVFVETGDIVKAGEPIGVMGSTGFSTGPHLHYEVRLFANDAWVAVNPARYIN